LSKTKHFQLYSKGTQPITPFGPIYKKHLTFLIHYINDLFGLYSRQDTSITQ